MALNAYLKMKGAKTGDLKGSVIQKGREGRIMVIAASHDVYLPTEATTGVASGKRMHKPFVITKELDRSSPLLYNMLVTNETITEWELQFWRPQANAAAGSEQMVYSVKLTNARIIDIRFSMPNNKNPDLMRYNEYEEIAFAYQKIQWTWTDGGITATDDWAAQI